MTFAFDMYGTLFDTSSIAKTVAPLAGSLTDEMVSHWRNKQLEYAFRRAAMEQYVDFEVCTRQALAYVLNQYGLSATDAQVAQIMQAYGSLNAFEEVRTTLERLQAQHHRLLVFSNGNKAAIEQLLNDAGIRHLLEQVVSVEDVRALKPNPKVYAHLAAQTDDPPSALFLISANPFDVIGAKAAGLCAIWLRRQPKAQFDPWEYQPDHTIESLSELKNLVR